MERRSRRQRTLRLEGGWLPSRGRALRWEGELAGQGPRTLERSLTAFTLVVMLSRGVGPGTVDERVGLPIRDLDLRLCLCGLLYVMGLRDEQETHDRVHDAWLVQRAPTPSRTAPQGSGGRFGRRYWQTDCSPSWAVLV